MEQLVQLNAKQSQFDSHHPPEEALMDDCVHCGFCLPACPTYVLWGKEMDSPRGRIYMMRKAAEGEAALDQRFRLHMDNCLGCMGCMTACPSGVRYDRLIEDTRAQVERNIPRGLADVLLRKLIFATFPYENRLRMIALGLRIYQRAGLQRALRSSGILRLLPKRLSAMEALLPQVPGGILRRLPDRVSAGPAPRKRVGMLSGCVQQVFFSNVNAATARVLAAEGFDVIIPRRQPCCGALMVHSGLENEAAGFARRMIEAFESANVECVVVNAAGCGSTMKEYERLLRDDPEWTVRAAKFSAKCVDISELLGSSPARATRHPLPMRVAYHDACHLRHAQGVAEQPRKLLAEIPQLELVEFDEPSVCCGSAGIYNLLNPSTAEQLGDRKAENILASKPDAVAFSNPGCMLQFMKSLRHLGHKELPVYHLAELLDLSIQNKQPEVPHR